MLLCAHKVFVVVIFIELLSYCGKHSGANYIITQETSPVSDALKKSCTPPGQGTSKHAHRHKASPQGISHALPAWDISEAAAPMGHSRNAAGHAQSMTGKEN